MDYALGYLRCAKELLVLKERATGPSFEQISIQARPDREKIRWPPPVVGN